MGEGDDLDDGVGDGMVEGVGGEVECGGWGE